MRQGRTEYTPGTNVFAKLKGYPWWPARIEADHTVPATVLKQKTKSKGGLYTVFFYGSKDYGFFGPDAIRPFDKDNVENDLKANKFKSKDLEHAVRQALNPDLNETKKKTEKRKSQLEQEVNETLIADKTNKKKKRKSSTATAEPIETEEENLDKEEFKKSPEYKRLYHIRHRLQRLVYGKHQGEIPKEDYDKILQVVEEIEETPMTYTLLKETKIGKVVKAACSYDFEGDTDIKERCHQLMRNWKHLVLNPNGKEDIQMQDA